METLIKYWLLITAGERIISIVVILAVLVWGWFYIKKKGKQNKKIFKGNE